MSEVFGTPVTGFAGARSASSLAPAAFDVAAGSLIIACCGWSDGGTAVVTDSSNNSYTQLTTRTIPSGVGFLQWSYCLAAKVDPANTVTANFSAANNYSTLGVWVIPLNGTATYDTDSDIGLLGFSGTFTTTGTDEFVAGFLLDGGTSTAAWAAAGGYTADSTGFLATGGGGFFSAAEHKLFSTTQSAVTLNMTSATVSFSSMIAVAFKGSPPPTFSIAGNAGIAGAAIALTGTATGSTTSAGDGTYSFTGLLAGGYTITPTLAKTKFNPVSHAETITSGNITGVNFVASSAYSNHRSK